MGSDNNCNNYFNVEQTSGASMSTPYYQTLGSQNQSPMRNSSEWMSPAQNSDVNSSSQSQESESSSQHDQEMRESEMNSRSQRTYNHPSSQQHLHMSGHPPWSFPTTLTNPYQRFYSDSHYGTIISPNVSQQSSLASTPNTSLHSLNNEVQTRSFDVHQMKSNQHLKKAYYQGLMKFLLSSTENYSWI